MDFTSQYNTKLNPEEEKQFAKWLALQTQVQGRDVSKDLQDYDLRGFYKNKESLSDSGHGSDLYKKPNHPTFSDQSLYHNVDNWQGGTWTQSPDGQNTFEASPMNTLLQSKDDLQKYFNKVEPETNLKFKNLKNKLQGNY